MQDKNNQKQVNKIIDHIHAHLEGDLSVKAILGLADLSPYHFHRIFTVVMGETLARYVLRKRLEKAAALLLSDESSPVANIASECGFNSANVFCRNFKRRFGVTCEDFRRKNRQTDSKNRPSEHTNSTAQRSYSRYLCPCKTIITGTKTMKCTFEIKKLSALEIIYCRHYGPLNQMQGAFTKLLQWAAPRGLVTAPDMSLLSVFHDHPAITEPEKLTADACMSVGRPVKTDGEIGAYRIEAGLYAVGRFEIGLEEFPNAWNATFELLKEHGCTCTDGHHYEIYRTRADEHPQNKWVVDICIPVKLQ